MIEVCLLLLIYIFFTSFCVTVLLINSIFYFSAIHLKLSVFACMCVREREREREEERDIVLADATL